MRTKELPSDESIRWGLVSILERVMMHKPRLASYYDTPCRLSRHPFGLEIPGEQPGPEEGYRTGRELLFVGMPGLTDPCVNNMQYQIADHLVQSRCPVEYLRVIYVTTERGSSDHDVYFEFGTKRCIFLTGGCTDCSGAGGSGKQMLDGLFKLLSVVYHVEIMEEEVMDLRGKIQRDLEQKMHVAKKKEGLE